ncbi:major facilitator superfamily domain-containing protein [Rhodofomes roseus]|uniref:Major facilitator superfamily domain-containing protein n=1 Tax=Rhodofomes roseus TaxID=34475 RepID=A0ABQ8JXP7_9APHY|nr:major facilitator superfamily domain-containing protein [Rhodofomes roseus]KAH9828967.1 major facilitator superfamily domain-containing protein [Rhodofomes roseus]
MADEKRVQAGQSSRTSGETLAVGDAASVPKAEDSFTPITKDLGFIPIPRRLRYDPERPVHFGLLLNATFGIASTFIVANLYYCQPLLIEYSKSFGVTYDEVSNIPTLIQAGYATGIVFISTLGDLVRRRGLLLLLVFISASLTIGLAVTNSLAAFEAICFIIGMVSVVPQILMPLAADLAPPERRASALSIVLAGLLLGVLIARVLAGIIAQFASWRVVYYMAIGVQYAVWGLLYLMLPDYPAKNAGATYFGILYSMAKFSVTEPQLIQAALINLASSACFSNFWVTLTFLLGGPPYYYSTLVIGLFGLVGMFGVAMAPLVGRVIDGLVPWFAGVVAILWLLVFQSIGVGADGINIAAVVFVCIGLDVFRQMVQVSLTSSVFGLDASARSRLNAVLLLSLFMGQVMGTSVGTQVFVKYGWRPAAALSLAWTGFMLFMMLLRGPHVKRYTWFGYEGGIEARKSKLAERERQREADAEAAVAANELGSADVEETSDSKETRGATAKSEKQAIVDEERGAAPVDSLPRAGA